MCNIVLEYMCQTAVRLYLRIYVTFELHVSTGVQPLWMKGLAVTLC